MSGTAHVIRGNALALPLSMSLPVLELDQALPDLAGIEQLDWSPACDAVPLRDGTHGTAAWIARWSFRCGCRFTFLNCDDCHRRLLWLGQTKAACSAHISDMLLPIADLLSFTPLEAS